MSHNLEKEGRHIQRAGLGGRLGWEPVSMIKRLRMKVNFEDTLTPFLHSRDITFQQSESFSEM